jgi:hypothetical protein
LTAAAPVAPRATSHTAPSLAPRRNHAGRRRRCGRAWRS